ncbi:hypothetical protein EON63_15180 [archaeon]|nr:MAG: hypothetical protein EON63_15180 [archaeon]
MHPTTHFKHEDWSVCIFRSLMSKQHIHPYAYGLTEMDVQFISEIISGTKPEDRKGRPAHKFYLYDVINNTRSGMCLVLPMYIDMSTAITQHLRHPTPSSHYRRRAQSS